MKANEKESNNSLKTKDDLTSLSETIKQIRNKIWRWLPKWLRLTIVFIIIIVGPIVSTQSYWYPFLKKQFSKPPARYIFGGYIYLENNFAAETMVQLLDQRQEVVVKMASDSQGYVVFNIPKNKKITIIRCMVDDQWQDFEVDDKKLKSSTNFNLFINEKRIEWQ